MSQSYQINRTACFGNGAVSLWDGEKCVASCECGDRDAISEKVRSAIEVWKTEGRVVLPFERPEAVNPWADCDFGGLPDAREGKHDCNAHRAVDSTKGEVYCAVCGKTLLRVTEDDAE